MENNKLITREYFNNEYLSEVTMIQDDEKIVWFKGVDIARILGYSNREKAIRMHVEEDEKKKPQNNIPHAWWEGSHSTHIYSCYYSAVARSHYNRNLHNSPYLYLSYLPPFQLPSYILALW